MGLGPEQGRSGKDPARGVLRRLLAALAAVVAAGAVTVVGTATPALAITAVRDLSVGHNHTCAVTVVYDLFCWGDNSNGKLGLGDDARRKKPTRVPGAGKWLSVAAGKEHTCALRRDSTIYCWGKRANNGATSFTPVRGDMGWKQITAGREHTCGVKTDGTAHCWGDNTNGQVGLPYPPKNNAYGDSCRKSNGQTIPCTLREIRPPWFQTDLFPVIAWDQRRMISSYDPRGGYAHDPDVIGDPDSRHFRLVEKWSSINTEGDTTCGVSVDGDRYCWGTDYKQGLGLGEIVPPYLPDGVWTDQFDNPTSTPEDDHITWQSVGMASGFSGCGISTGTRLYCWGNNSKGQLGLGDTATRILPTRVDKYYEQVDGGDLHTCGVKINGEGYCWGDNSKGQLGIGNTKDKTTPQRVDGSMRWQKIEAGGVHSCGISFENALYCWGLNDRGQLGDNTTTTRTSPRQVA